MKVIDVDYTKRISKTCQYDFIGVLTRLLLFSIVGTAVPNLGVTYSYYVITLFETTELDDIPKASNLAHVQSRIDQYHVVDSSVVSDVWTSIRRLN